MRAVRPAPGGYIHSVVALDQTPAGSTTQKHHSPKSVWPPLPPLALRGTVLPGPKGAVRCRRGAPPVMGAGGLGLRGRWKGYRRGGREIKARSGTTAPAIIKELSVGHGLISCLQARRGGRWARLLQPAAHRSFLPLYQPPSPAIPTRYGHRAAPVAAAAERPLAAGCQSTGNLQPLQQRSRKEALLAVCCVQQLASTCATARSYKQTRPPAKRLRGCAQQRRKNLVASC